MQRSNSDKAPVLLKLAITSMVIVNHGEEDHHECEDALDQRHGVGDGDPGDGDGV